MKKGKEIYIGKTFGKLTILSFIEPKIYIKKTGHKSKIHTIKCICSCGNSWVGGLSSVERGLTKSCGCSRKEITSNRFKTHGLSKSLEYDIYCKMKARCLNIEDKDYHYYGGRGITVCDRWLESFENFIEDMGMKPGKEYSIDRVDNNLGYSKGNCKWATRKEQSNNQRGNRIISYRGKKQNLKSWCQELNLPYSAIVQRLNTYGWSIEKSFETPIKIRNLD